MRNLIIFLFFLLLIPLTSQAAISFDNATISTGSNGITTKSATHTITTGDDTIAIISVYSNNAPSSVTLASTTATSSGISQDNGDGYYYRIYYVLNPTTGTVTVTANFSGASFAHLAVVSYHGVNQTTPINASSGTSSASATDLTLNFTTLEDDSWLVGFWSNYAVGGLSAGSNTTLRASMSDGTWFYSGGIADSNQAYSPAGSYSIQGNFTAGRALALGVALTPSETMTNVASDFFYYTVGYFLLFVIFVIVIWGAYKMFK